MSAFAVRVVRVGDVTPHPNADALDLMNVDAYPVIVRRGDFRAGDLAAYVPIDSLVPATPEWAFLTPAGAIPRPERIRAKRLRGIFSMGLLTRAPEGSAEGDDVTERLGVVKWEQPESLSTSGDDERAPSGLTLPVYDIENWRAHSNLIAEGEPVAVTEKIHGCNARFVWTEERLWAFSRTRCKRESDASVWWRAAKRADLTTKLATAPGIAVYGEVYGQVQDLKYGETGVRFRAFDVFDTARGTYLDVDAFREFCFARDIDTVPELFRGPYSRDALLAHVGGKTVAGEGAHIREGVVVRPLKERRDDRHGRVILKVVSEDYLLRKGGTEHQ